MYMHIYAYIYAYTLVKAFVAERGDGLWSGSQKRLFPSLELIVCWLLAVDDTKNISICTNLFKYTQ